VAEVLLWGHVEAGFELSEKGAERAVGDVSELLDRDVVAVALMEETKGWSEFFVFAKSGASLLKWASDADDSTENAFVIVERFLGGGGPVDKTAASRN